MEKELDSKIFMINDYSDKNNMEGHIKEYIKKLKIDYPTADPIYNQGEIYKAIQTIKLSLDEKGGEIKK